MERVVSKVLNKVLGSFIENLDSEQLNISLIKGKIELKNLALKKDFLYLLGLPFEMNYGTAKNISVKISWRKLNSKSVKIIISEVYAYLTPKNPTNWDEHKEKDDLLKAKKMQLNRFEAMQVDVDEEDEEEEIGYIKKKILTVVNNLEIQVEDIYFRYEHNLKLQPSFTAGFYLRLLEIHTCNLNWEKQFINDAEAFFKYIKIDDFSIFIDHECQHKLTHFIEAPDDIAFEKVAQMEKNREIQHNFLLTPSFFEAKVIINSKGKLKKQPLLKLDLEINQTSLEFYTQHIALLVTVMNLIKLHNHFTAGVRHDLNEKPFEPAKIPKYKETYKKWMIATMKDKKKDAEKIMVELNEMEKIITVEDVIIQRSEAITEHKIGVALKKIEKIDGKMKSRSISKIFSDSQKLKLECEAKIKALEQVINELRSGKKIEEVQGDDWTKLEVLISFKDPRLKVYESMEVELLDCSMKKLSLYLKVVGNSPSFSLKFSQWEIVDLYEKSGIFPKLVDLELFSLEASVNPLSLSIKCSKLFVYIIFSTIFKTLSSIKEAVQGVKIEESSNFVDKYQVYVAKGQQFLTDNANKGQKSKENKAFFDLNLDIEAPVIFIPSGYTDKRSILCIDFGNFTSQSFSCPEKNGVILDHFPFQLTSFSVYTIWNWGDLRSSLKIDKNNILNPVETSIRITKPHPGPKVTDEITLKVESTPVEFTINAMSLQSIEEIFKLINKYAPPKQELPKERLSKVLAVQERIISSLVIQKSTPIKVDLYLEKLQLSFHEMKPVSTLLLNEIKLIGDIDSYKVGKFKFTVFEIYLKDERIEAPVRDIIVNPTISFISQLKKAQSKCQLNVNILSNAHKGIVDLAVNLQELKFFLSLDLINALFNTVMMDKNAFQFLQKAKKEKNDSAANYSRKKKTFVRFSAIFQELELIVPVKSGEDQLTAYVTTALTFIFESRNFSIVLYDQYNKVIENSSLTQDNEVNLVLSHFSISIKSENSHYTFVQPCRFMLESKIYNDTIKKYSKTSVVLRIESVVLFVGFKVLGFFSGFSQDLKKFAAKFNKKSETKVEVLQKTNKKVQGDIDVDAFHIFILNDKDAEIQSLFAHKCSYISFMLGQDDEVTELTGDIIMNTEYYNSILTCWEPIIEDSKLSVSLNKTKGKVDIQLKLPQIVNILITKGLLRNIASLTQTSGPVIQEHSKKVNKKSKVRIFKSFEYNIQNRLDIPFSIWLSIEKDPFNSYLAPNFYKDYSNEYVQKLSTLINQKAKSTSIMNNIQMPTIFTYQFSKDAQNLNADNLGYFIETIVFEDIEYEVLIYVASDTGKRMVVFDSVYKIANNTQFDLEITYKENKILCKGGELVSIPLTWTKHLPEIELKIVSVTFNIIEKEIVIDNTVLIHQISSYLVGKKCFKISEISYKYYIQNILHTEFEVFKADGTKVLAYNKKSFVDVGADIELQLKDSDEFCLKVHDDLPVNTELLVLKDFKNTILKICNSGKSVTLAMSEKVFPQYTCVSDQFEKITLDLSSLEKVQKSEFYPRKISVYSDYIVVNRSHYDLEIPELTIKRSSISYFSSDNKKTKIRLTEGLSEWSEPFRIDTIGVSSAIQIYNQSPPRPLTFGLLISNAPNPLKNTTIVQICPRFILWNYLDFDIYISHNSQYSSSIILPSGQNENETFLPFDFFNDSKNKEIEISMDNLNWSGGFYIENLNDFQVKVNCIKEDEGKKKFSLFSRDWFLPKENFQYRFIRVLITTMDEACIHIVFMNPKDPDFKIVNRTNQSISYKQMGVKDKEYEIKPGDSVPWAWDDHTVKKKKLEIKYEEVSGKYSIEKVQYKKSSQVTKINDLDGRETVIKKLKDCFVTVHIQDTTRELIIKHPSFKNIEDPSLTKKFTRNDSFTKKMLSGQGIKGDLVPSSETELNVKIIISKLGLSLFDSDSRENFYIYLEDMNTKLSVKNQNLPFKKEKNFRVKLKLKHFQIDSSDPDPSLFTVILAPMHLVQDKSSEEAKKQYFLMLELEIIDTEKRGKDGVFVPSMKIIENFDLVLQKIQAKINEEAILKLIHLGSLFQLLKSQKIASIKSSPLLSTSFPTLPYHKSTNLQKIYFHFVKLGVLQLSVTFKPSEKPKKSKESKKLVKLLRAVGGAFANISNASLNFKEIFVVNSFQTQQNFAIILVKNYVRQGVAQIYKIFGSIDILGNPLSLIDTLGTGVYEFMTEPAKGLIGGPKAFAIGLGRGVKSLTSSIIKGSFESAAKITGGLYNVLKSATGEKGSNQVVDSENIGKNMLTGLKEGANDVYNGITGLIVKPYRGAKNKGAKGFFVGVLSGTAGLITSPIKLVLKLGSVVTSGIASTATLIGQGKVQKYGRARFPRHWGPKLAVEPYNEIYAEAQAFLASFEEFREERVLYFTEINLTESEIVKRNYKTFLIITLNWFIFVVDGKLKNKVQIFDLEFLELHFYKEVYLLVVAEKKKRFVVLSQNFASLACIYNRLAEFGLGEPRNVSSEFQ